MVKAMRRAGRALAALMLAATAAACTDVSEPNPVTVEDILAESTQHITLRTAIAASGGLQALGGSDQLTVFAPTDDAFAALPAATQSAILNDPATRAAVLRNHIVRGREAASALTNGRRLTTAGGGQVTITRGAGGVQYGGANVLLENLSGANGVVHVIDRVVLPAGM